MREDVKRMNYYNGLFLKEEEFIAEQKYHIRLRRLMNKLLNNVYGVLEGLNVESVSNTQKYNVTSGTALSVIEEGGENLAAEIILPNDFEVDLSNPDFLGKSVYITISYDAKAEDSVPEKGDNPIHVVERPKVIGTLTNADPKKDIVLAVIKLPSDPNWKSNNAYRDTSQRREIPVTVRSINGIGSTDNGNIDIQAGSNIKITPDLAGNKLTISAGGGSQWADGTGGAIYYNKGNVGIGTATPAASLDITSAGEAFRAGNASSWFKVWTGGNSRLSLGNGNGKEAGFIAGGKNDKDENTLTLAGCDNAGNCPTYLTIHQNGNVGIGTTSPGSKLHVHEQATNSYIRISSGNAGANKIMEFYEGATLQASLITRGSGIAGGPPNALNIYTAVSGAPITLGTASGEKLRIADNGNVGIGTTDPKQKLHLYAGDNPTILRIQSAAAFGAGSMEFWSDPQGSTSEWRPGFIQSTDNGGFTGGLAFFTNGTGVANKTAAVEVMRIVNGNVGIGTPSPGSKLQVQYDNTHYVGTNVSTTQAYTTYHNAAYEWKVGSDGYDGNWYMITANGTDLFQIHQSGIMNVYCSKVYLRNTYNNAITSGRDVAMSSIGELGYISSSIRHKKNIRSIDEYSSKIYGLIPVVFDYKDNATAVNQFGLIAEEVEKTFPELVSYDDQQRPETVVYSKLVPLLLREVIRIKEQNDTLNEIIKQWR